MSQKTAPFFLNPALFFVGKLCALSIRRWAFPYGVLTGIILLRA
jgi:hypothetical protein